MIFFLAAMAAAAAQPQVVMTIDPKHRLVEGVATDGQTIWVSSLLDRQILACRATCRTIATLPTGLHPFAIAWDETRRRLWVAADCPPNVPEIKACERGSLLGLDVGGRVKTRIAPASGSFHPGDVSAANGSVFVSDSQNGAVYRLLPSGHALAALVAPGVGKSAQGSAVDPTGKMLIVADYSQGVGTIDLATGVRTLLQRQDGKTLRGVDGLVRCSDRYIGIYNGRTPSFPLTFTVSGDRLHFEELVKDLTLADPTQIAFDGKRLLIVTKAGWELLGKAGPARSEGAEIVAIPLSPDCRPA